MEMPEPVRRGLLVLERLQRLVESVRLQAGEREAHGQWLKRLRALQADEASRAEWAQALIAGPLDAFDEEAPDAAAQRRQRQLSAAVLEAAVCECGWPPRPEVLRQTLRQWLRQGAWRAEEEAPLSRIGRLIESHSDSAEDATAVRLGLLVPFWSSLALWAAMHEDNGDEDAGAVASEPVADAKESEDGACNG